MTQQNGRTRREFLKQAALVGGAASLAACQGPRARSLSELPRHNPRSQGWLRFIWQKATTPDHWDYSGPEELPWGIQLNPGPIDFSIDPTEPHPWWDQYSTRPYLSYPRFDLSDSSYPILLMADQTPAWREVYTRIMDELATRHTAYWAAIDWNTFIGPSPQRDDYPEAMMRAWPERLHGNYDFPGWVANGVEPWGLQPDPIGADGNLFFRGWLNLVLSIYKYVSGDDKWEQPWEIAGFENEKFRWTQPEVVAHLRQQYVDHPEGPHCENTKIWPLCNSAAGLGIYLSDQLGGRRAHGVFEDWVQFARDNYMGINGRNELEWSTAYYDPIEEFRVNGGAGGGVGLAFYLLPQSPELATLIYDSAANALGWRDASRDIAPSAQGLALALALGDHQVAERLRAASERRNEPRFFGEQDQMFGFWFGRDEPWPRGQGTAQLMLSEVAEGDWAQAFSVRHLDKYTAPTLAGVNYPVLGIDQAWNDKETGRLSIGSYVGEAARRGEATSWTVENLPDARSTRVICDGEPLESVEYIDEHTLRVHTEVERHQYELLTGYHGQALVRREAESPALAGTGAAYAARRRSAAENVQAVEAIQSSGSMSCPCCSA